MTIQAGTRRAGPYTTDGVDTAFTFEFKVFEGEDLLVTLTEDGVDTTAILTTEYTVSLNADQDNNPGGTVTMLAAPDGPTLVITSQMVVEQPAVFTNTGGFYPRVLNDALDRTAIGLQQVEERLDRVPQAPIGGGTPGDFPVLNAEGGFDFSDATGPAGPVGPAGDVAKEASRGALAAVAASAGLARYLVEAGREGLFVFSAANLSAMVTLDTRQAVYVAPASDATGASGAWVRKFSGPLDTAWFGSVADCTAYNTGTDNSPAFQAAINFLYARGGWMHTGDGKYRCSTRLLNKSAIKWTGTTLLQDSTGASNPGASRGTTLVFDTNVNGLRNSFVVDGDVAGGIVNPGAGGTIIEGIRFLSSNDKTVAAGNYGVENRAKVTMRNCIVRGFGDHGIYTRASLTGSDGVVYGNANNCRYEAVDAIRNAGHGFASSGNDANNITFDTCSGQDNGDHDFNDDGLINNMYLNCLSEGGDLGSFRTIRVAAVHSFLGCNDEGGTNSIGASCFVRGGTVGQKANGQTHEMHGRVLAYDGGTIRNGTTLSFNNTGDATTLDISNDGTNILVGAPIKAMGSVQCRVGSIGYLLGNGGAVTQATNKTTGVTLNTTSGQIAMNNAALAAGAKVSFTVTNSTVAVTDSIIANVSGGGTANAYRVAVTAVANGIFTLTVENITAGSLSEAPVINFALIKGQNG